jgi:hypothetical protein
LTLSSLVMEGSFWHTRAVPEDRHPRPSAAPESAISAPPSVASEAADRPVGEHREIGGPPGPEPTRFGDWERGGRCIDF